MHEVLMDLQAGLDRIEALEAEIRSRHDAASTIAGRSLNDRKEPWQEVRTRIARSRLYGDLDLAPQLGLVPLGPDPASHLEEFAHLGSGSVPRRDVDSGALVYEDDAAIVLVLLPGGIFWMGAQKKDEKAHNYDRHAKNHESDENGRAFEVTLPPFFLAKHECTQAQWMAMTGGPNPSNYKAGETWGEKLLTRRNPVEQVSWEDCNLWFGRWNLALPTEAQWEQACRAGTDTPWFTGDEASSLQGYANIADAWLKAHGGPDSWPYTEEVNDGHSAHAPVGSFRPNDFGLYDMHGNVWEFCRDLKGSHPPTPARLLAGPGKRVHRGGTWNLVARTCRSAYRYGYDPGVSNFSLGARPARAVTP